jgi:hypothetical protein
MQPEGIAFFGTNCNDPNVTWDDTHGQWWGANTGRGPCRISTAANDNGQYFQPPVQRRSPSQMGAWNIYPISSGGVQALMGDGSVRGITPSVSIRSWSAAVTPNGGEAVSLDQ